MGSGIEIRRLSLILTKNRLWKRLYSNVVFSSLSILLLQQSPLARSLLKRMYFSKHSKRHFRHHLLHRWVGAEPCRSDKCYAKWKKKKAGYVFNPWNNTIGMEQMVTGKRYDLIFFGEVVLANRASRRRFCWENGLDGLPSSAFVGWRWTKLRIKLRDVRCDGAYC